MVGARIFISCGQSKESGELQIAREIRARLEQLGFDPYVALEEQTLRGVRENIFEQLRKSEYFVFVDFKREPLRSGESRGLPRVAVLSPRVSHRFISGD